LGRGSNSKMNELPQELWVNILEFLDYGDMARSICVCWYWHDLINNPFIVFGILKRFRIEERLWCKYFTQESSWNYTTIVSISGPRFAHCLRLAREWVLPEQRVLNTIEEVLNSKILTQERSAPPALVIQVACDSLYYIHTYLALPVPVEDDVSLAGMFRDWTNIVDSPEQWLSLARGIIQVYLLDSEPGAVFREYLSDQLSHFLTKVSPELAQDTIRQLYPLIRWHRFDIRKVMGTWKDFLLTQPKIMAHIGRQRLICNVQWSRETIQQWLEEEMDPTLREVLVCNAWVYQNEWKNKN
jgi:hypothetical protein